MIDVCFSIISGKKQTLRVKSDSSVSDIKKTLSLIVDSPPHTLTLLHKARILKDDEYLKDLNFKNRKYIAVSIRKKPVTLMKQRETLDNQQGSLLKSIFGENFEALRQNFLDNPAFVPILMAYIEQSDPANARLLSENPQILLRLLGITPDEFLNAINNMSLRNNQNQQPQRQQDQQQNQQQQQQQQDQQQQQQQDQQQNQQQQQQLNNDTNDNEQQNSNEDVNHAEEEVNQTNQTGNSNNTDDTNHNSNENNDNGGLDVSGFLETMTQEDLDNLQLVLSTNVSLEEAILVFLRNGKNVENTIAALQRRSS